MLVLGSASEARKQLLESINIFPELILKPEIDESPIRGEKPLVYVKRMAFQKSRSLYSKPSDLLLTSDTVVAQGARILLKTNNRDIARDYLFRLSGKRHKVYTAMCIKYGGKEKVYVEKTSLKMRKLNDIEIEKYLETNEWINKAGGYSIQGRAESFFPFISGSFSNVIGLPLPKLINIFKGLGLKIP